MILTTERLVLRPQETSDSVALFAILGDPQAMRFWSRPAVPRLAVVDEIIRVAVAASRSSPRRMFIVRANLCQSLKGRHR